MPETVVGLDIGGANLKAAHSSGVAVSVPFALWKQPAKLPDVLRALLNQLPPARCMAVTMTGELCDCYASRREGVLAILDAIQAATPGKPVLVWTLDRQFVFFAVARQHPQRVGSANWLALAHWIGRSVPQGNALLFDIGSTTTDLIPLRDGQPIPVGDTDMARLASGELLYTGATRTPVCAVQGFEGAAELFATMQDVYIVLGEVPEAPHDNETADGRPATLENAQRRLARMMCGDLETTTLEQRAELAGGIARKQVRALLNALKQVVARTGPPKVIVTAGTGEFLVERVLQVQKVFPEPRVLSLGQMLGREGSAAACAHAVALLAGDWLASRK